MNSDSNTGTQNHPDSGFHIVIPARYGSTRFPGKPLHPLLGKPMILHVVDRALASTADSVVVATDDERIAAVCVDADVEVVMTRADHPSGTDRIAEVAKLKNWEGGARIVGLQGDEPGMPSAHIDRLAANLVQHPDAAMATLCFPVQSVDDWRNPDRVKVVRDNTGMALYFSRAPIPHFRDGESNSAVPKEACIHIGIYAYRADFLASYGALPASKLEQLEQLEQLRVLDAGYKIHVDEVGEAAAHGVDRQEDVKTMEKILQEQFENE